MNAPCLPCPPFPPFPPFPANPAVGDRFGSWVWTGNQWIVSSVGGLVVNLQNIQTSGVYVPSPGLLYAQVEGIGGGGGGGGAQGGVPFDAGPPPSSGPGWVTGGGGGSGGTYCRSVFPGVLLTGGVQVTIGPGGAGGQAVTPGIYGGQGGTTTFGALVVAPGGFGGGTNIVVGGVLDFNFGQGADPALVPGQILPPGISTPPPAVGQFVGFGNAGQSGGTNFFDPSSTGAAGQSLVWGGTGGPTFLSGTWASEPQTGGANPGRAGMAAGVGGGGGASAYIGDPAIGGNGAPGVVLVTEYCMLPVGSGSGASCCQSCGQPAGSCGCGGRARVAWTGRHQAEWDDQ